MKFLVPWTKHYCKMYEGRSGFMVAGYWQLMIRIKLTCIRHDYVLVKAFGSIV